MVQNLPPGFSKGLEESLAILGKVWLLDELGSSAQLDELGSSAQYWLWVGGGGSDCKGFSRDQCVHSPISSSAGAAAAPVGSDSCVPCSSAACQGLSAPTILGVG